MHPAFVTAIAAAQRQDKLARAAASRRARQARLARPGSQPKPSPRRAMRRPHGPAEPLCPAVPSTHERQKVGA
jgi:hypothetical protein